MADILFRYLLMARERDQHWYQRVILADERLLAAGVERVVQTAAVVVRVQAQCEHVSSEHVVRPRSVAERTRFYDRAARNPPVAPVPESRVERFPLERTRTYEQCVECKTTGRAPCMSCGGHGRVPCICAGESIPSCSYCSGKAHVQCVLCHGQGHIEHERCGGEGELVRWEEEVHTYSVRWLHDAHFPANVPASAARAVDAWISLHPEPFTELTPSDIAAHLGYESAEASTLLAKAERGRSRLEARVRESAGQCLFLVPAFYVVPVAACVLRSERTASAVRYWLVGRGEDAIEIVPFRVWDWWKIAGWCGLGGALLGAQAAAETVGGIARELWSGGALLGLAIAGLGLWRLIAGRAPVRTVAILRAPGSNQSFLPLFATLGSFVRRLHVRDRSYRAQLEAMMRQAEPLPVTQSLVIRLPGGSLARLSEIANPDALSQGELARMAEAVDGVILLEEPGRSADAIRARIHGATTARPPEARLLLDPAAFTADESGATPHGAIAIEWIRRAFMREIDANPDWPAVFDLLWRPVGLVLSGSKRAAVWPASQLKGAGAR